VALGLPRRQLIRVGTIRNLWWRSQECWRRHMSAFALSPLAPVGEARLAEPSPGLAFDPLVLLLGALATVVVVLALGLGGPRYAPRVSEPGVARTANRYVDVAHLAATGAPPSAVIGIRHALERGRGAASVPVEPHFFGTVIAVTALCATAVFGASLSHLTTTPALYGQDYQITFSANQGIQPKSWPRWSAIMPSPGIMVGQGMRYRSTG